MSLLIAKDRLQWVGQEAMKIDTVLEPDRVFLDLRSSSKTRLLDELARKSATALNVEAGPIFDALMKREKLGSTGVGNGVAIPHARIETIGSPVGFFARLKPPADFDAIDGRKVDLVFLLLTPAQASGDHLNALACVSRLLRNSHVATTLRSANTAQQAYSILTL